MIINDVIKDHICSDTPFAFIRFPQESKFYLIIPDEKGANKYIFHSFDSSKNYEFRFSFLTPLNYSELSDLNEIHLSESLIDNSTISIDNYIQLIDKAISILKLGNMDKIVLSRDKWISNSSICPLKSFRYLADQYPNSFIHLSYWNKNEVWLGATPETLGSWENSVFTTMALAGTLPDNESSEWQTKEKDEQQYVTDYILKQLKKLSVKPLNIRGPESLHLGIVKHLVTYFSFPLEDKQKIKDIISGLHPTPAVCGLPTKESKEFILNEESYSRDFYSGYIGIQTESYEKYYVNLRCSKLYNNGALLFVGGGITAQSNPEKEWKETEFKAKFISDSL
ncbi:chorismate-binding protein [Apibacter sp. HY039]|uniref:chorismate-binding protein n=1 Tax=Apibacter sp. HY039 TaxID=2501476 RepID=UPI000FEBB660|nr:chorismate-binding protein [Apibacter sp. HY039]